MPRCKLQFAMLEIGIATLELKPSLQPIFDHYVGTCVVVFRYLGCACLPDFAWAAEILVGLAEHIDMMMELQK